MNIYNLFTAASLALTVPALFGCAAVVYLWSKSALRAWRAAHKSETNWFVIGVTIGFIGSLFDNLYWFVAWTADYYQLPVRDWLFRNGVYSNTLFRQVATILAALCHVRAAVETDSRPFRWLIGLSWVSATVLTGLIYLSKY